MPIIFVGKIFYKRVILWKQGLHQITENCQVYKSSGPDYPVSANLGLNSDPRIFSKLQNEINYPKGLENKIYTMMKDREIFYGDHTVPITSCSEVQYIL